MPRRSSVAFVLALTALGLASVAPSHVAVSAQDPPVRLNRTIEKLQRGEAVVGAIMRLLAIRGAAVRHLRPRLHHPRHGTPGARLRAPADVLPRDDRQGGARSPGPPAGPRAAARAHPDLRARPERVHRQAGPRHGSLRHHVSRRREQGRGRARRAGRAVSSVEGRALCRPPRDSRQRQHARGVVLGLSRAEHRGGRTPGR